MKKIITSLFVCLFSFATQAQNKILISGNIADNATKEPLPFVSVSLKKQLIGTVSNENGNFDLYVSDEMMN
ncbi:MAG: carboxypeptidase-like regulatory domain-containing protein, partial [Bacteroidetes bacterium]|nr:carboxypeptidase-like regulatory domain-containing protein [Bacteroidota bacterium]